MIKQQQTRVNFRIAWEYMVMNDELETFLLDTKGHSR